MTRVAQWKRVADYLQSHKSITNDEARDVLRIMDVSKRICELQERGYQIEHEWIRYRDASGYPQKYMRYWLRGIPNG